jgi:hypothetical protein
MLEGRLTGRIWRQAGPIEKEFWRGTGDAGVVLRRSGGLGGDLENWKRKSRVRD